jgi:hypothetical protein
MSAIVPTIATDKMRANVAGHTVRDPATPVVEAEPVANLVHSIGDIGSSLGIGNLFNGGEDAVSTPIDKSVSVPTDSVRGRLGGLAPALRSVVSPGPTVTPDSAAHVEPHAADGLPKLPNEANPGGTASHVLGRIRGALRL